MRRGDSIRPIVEAITLDTTPTLAFRALTSQTELRKWWAPRVITARGIVSVEDGKDIEMKLLQQEPNRLVRYNWRPLDWDDGKPETVLTFEIEDLGVSRSETGQGICITATQAGWVDANDRERQAEILRMALAGLHELLEKKKTKSWWKQPGAHVGYHRIQLSALKEFSERIEKENRGKSDKKLAAQNIWKLCQNLDSQGEWFAQDSEDEYELHVRSVKVFGVQKKGIIALAWPELEKLVGKRKLKELANRLALEQDVDVGPARKQDLIPANRTHVDLLTRWFADLLEEARAEE